MLFLERILKDIHSDHADTKGGTETDWRTGSYWHPMMLCGFPEFRQTPTLPFGRWRGR